MEGNDMMCVSVDGDSLLLQNVPRKAQNPRPSSNGYTCSTMMIGSLIIRRPNGITIGFKGVSEKVLSGAERVAEERRREVPKRRTSNGENARFNLSGFVGNMTSINQGVNPPPNANLRHTNVPPWKENPLLEGTLRINHTLATITTATTHNYSSYNPVPMHAPPCNCLYSEPMGIVTPSNQENTSIKTLKETSHSNRSLTGFPSIISVLGTPFILEHVHAKTSVLARSSFCNSLLKLDGSCLPITTIYAGCRSLIMPFSSASEQLRVTFEGSGEHSLTFLHASSTLPSL
uniref:Uncharacterized protein n=1 Tax=Tanacetum cinerariifolium TaxID=118510 RepID=A0A699HA40_TANCI|nr:hypothetical protein [Tanacetum cinerariifolium]